MRSGRARNIQSKAEQSADHRFKAQHSTQRQQQVKEITAVVVWLPQQL
jgi:cbb3-type cytochrome oxidase cytochrome c subunit